MLPAPSPVFLCPSRTERGCLRSPSRTKQRQHVGVVVEFEASAGVGVTPEMMPHSGETGRVTDFAAEESEIAGLYVLRMKESPREPRGVVREAFRASAFAQAGLDVGPWQQINVTETVQGGVRGLHGENMVKLVAVVTGSAFGAYLDTRPASPSFGRVVTVDLTVGTQLLVPAGVCNGFQVTSAPDCQYLYCFTSEWVPNMGGVAVNPLDPALAIDWPIAIDPSNRAQLSEKDAGLPNFADLELGAR